MSSNPSRPSFQNPITPNSPRMPNVPANVRKGSPPQFSLSRQQDPNFQQALTNNLLMQQTMLNEQLNQYRMQDMVKQQLLRYAIDAPTENLQRELKNSNAFVRWAASVELNRRWKAEKPAAVARAKAEPPPATRLALEFTQTIRAATPARVAASNDQTLLLQYGLPK